MDEWFILQKERESRAVTMMTPTESITPQQLQELTREDGLVSDEYMRNQAQKDRRAERYARRLADKRGGRR